jgi:hypothetical protein
MTVVRFVMVMILGFTIVGCSSWQEKKAPCTYDHRAACGKPIE